MKTPPQWDDPRFWVITLLIFAILVWVFVVTPNVVPQ